MRLIDADLLMKELGITDPDCEKCELGGKGFPYCTRDGDFVDACDAICEAPTVDAVQVVRCKDCKHRDADDFCTGRGYPNGLVPDGGFCDKGERREDGEGN